MRDMKVLHTIRDVPPNPYGLCALSITDSSPYVAYPGSSIIGEIQIFDIINLVSKAFYCRSKIFISDFFRDQVF